MTNSQLKMILIHGAGGTQDKWRAILPLLEGEDVVAIDLPAHGANETEAKTSIEAFADELAEQLTEDCIVAGHSMGGLIALELAHKSEFVKGVALIASSYELPVHPKIIASLGEGEFPEFLFKASYAKGTDPALLAIESEQKDAFPTDVAQKDFQACTDYTNGAAVLETLKIPVVAILGEEDKLIPKETAENLRSVNASVDVELIPNSGHYNLLETPEKVADVLLNFKRTVETKVKS